MSQDRYPKLFQRFKAGDQEAFKSIFDRYVGLIQFIGGKFNLSKSERDDVVQETFLRLHRNLGKIESFEKIKPWLCITARNYIINLKRAEKKKRDFKTEVEILNRNGDSTSLEPLQPSASLVREMEINLIQDLIDELGSPLEKRTFKKFYVEKVSVKAIAAENRETVGSVTSRLSRFRKKIKESVKKRIDKLEKESEH